MGLFLSSPHRNVWRSEGARMEPNGVGIGLMRWKERTQQYGAVSTQPKPNPETSGVRE